MPEQDASRLDPISLAFVGDAYYALYLRRRLVQTDIPNVQVLHLLASEFVSAKAQAYVYRHIKETLDETEASASGPAMPIHRRRRARPSPSITTARRWKPWWDT